MGKPTIAVIMEGGLVQNILSHGIEPFDLYVIDYDVEGTSEPENRITMPGGSEALVSHYNEFTSDTEDPIYWETLKNVDL